MQQGDVKLFQTVDDGEITVVDGVVEMSGGLETSVYLSMFGGNEDDTGSDGNPHTWWGNLDETGPVRQYRSETQNLLQSLPATTGNLRRVEDAANRDVAWMLEIGVASSITILASLPRLNVIQIDVQIQAVGEESQFTFVENWKAGQ